MTRIFRIAPANHPEFDGLGAARYPGRWNHRGIRMAYASEHLAVAMIETLANSGELPRNRVWRMAEVPEEIVIEELTVLPPTWDAEEPTKAARDIGTEWAKSKRTALLKVPSAVVPGAFNYLVNPQHPDATRIIVGPVQPLSFDTRLKGPAREG